MASSYGQCSLFLRPDRYDYTPTDETRLVSGLRHEGLIGEKINTPHDYLVGERFLDYIAYLGCSPAIEFEPDAEGENFCFIRIHHYTSPRLIRSHKQARKPQCPVCNKPISNQDVNSTAGTLLCESCHTESALEQINWRKMAGYAQLFIEISDIFPREAIPQQLLLDRLSQLTETSWSYFYACQ